MSALMDEDYQLRYLDKPDDPVWEAIGGGIQRHNTEHAGDDRGRRLCFSFCTVQTRKLPAA